MLFPRKIPAATLAVFLSVLAFLAPSCLAQDCTGAKDWKDIYILPTNPHPQSNIKVSLSVDKQRVQPGDQITLNFRSDRECYLTIMDVGTSGRILRLWPNDYSGSDNRCPANTPMCFPAPEDGFRYRIAGPEGTERIIAYATAEKGKILGDQEFRSLQNSGFKEFSGNTKDLAIAFQRKADSLPSAVPWGTAQLNLCIAGPPPAAPNPQDAAPISPAPRQSAPRPSYERNSAAEVSRSPTEESAKMCVLAVGIPLGKVKHSVRDAEMFIDVMKRKVGVKETNIRRVFGPEATYNGFVAGLDWLASRTQPEDTAVIYYSGHGSQIPDQPPLDEADGKDECFVLYHTEKPSDWRDALRKKILLVDDEFNVLVKRIPARRKIIVVDACHSGTIDKRIGSEDEDLVSKFYPLRDPDTGQEMWGSKSASAPTHYGNDHETLLSSCLDSESSYEFPDRPASIFTFYLVKGINEGARDLETAFRQAKVQASDYVIELARRKRKQGVTQTPQLTDPHGIAKTFTFFR